VHIELVVSMPASRLMAACSHTGDPSGLGNRPFKLVLPCGSVYPIEVALEVFGEIAIHDSRLCHSSKNTISDDQYLHWRKVFL